VIVSKTGLQRIQGFGASGAWWPNDLVAFPDAVQDQVAALLFSKAGIQLSSYRFNIGAGGSLADPVRETQSFLVRPGVWDWSRDAGGMTFLRLAHLNGVPVLTGFANSAPPFWTTNGRVCGGRLAAGDENAYASYLAHVVSHLRAADGITLAYLSPMNEPDASFAGCGQEGMAVPVDRRARLVDSVRKALGVAGPTRVLADESSQAAQLDAEGPSWGPGARAGLGTLAHHGYDYPGYSAYRKAAALAASLGVPLRMTETCCYDGGGFGPQYDPTITSGLWLANTIWRALELGRESGFDWWTAVSPELGCDPAAQPGCPAAVNGDGWNDGLLYYDRNFRQDGNDQIYATKRFWVLGNFSRWVRPGAVRHDVVASVAGVRMLAFLRGHRWTVVAIDGRPAGSARVGVRVSLPLSPSNRIDTVRAYRTGERASLSPESAPGTSPGGTAFFARLPPQSVTTLVVHVMPR